MGASIAMDQQVLGIDGPRGGRRKRNKGGVLRRGDVDTGPEGVAGITTVSKPWARTERCVEGSSHWVSWKVELSSEK